VAHFEQREFCERLVRRWPHLFEGKSVLDCGALDINGNNRHLFTGCNYTGIDITEGANVDHVSLIHEFTGGPFGVVISTECLEHDAYASESIQRMIKLVADDGILIVTCATTGRIEHGTTDSHPGDSPATHGHYRNIVPSELVVPLRDSFRCWGVEVIHGDLYGWGLGPIRQSSVTTEAT